MGWSPDERELLVLSDLDRPGSGFTDVYRLDLVTGKLTRLTNGGDVERASPSFSPDGSAIVFTTHVPIYPWDGPAVIDAKNAVTGAFAIDARGGTALRRLTTPGFAARSPAFSPDGTQLALHGAGGIYVMNVDGSDIRLAVPGEPKMRHGKNNPSIYQIEAPGPNRSRRYEAP
jgi:Tol biopolymer transport system component